MAAVLIAELGVTLFAQLSVDLERLGFRCLHARTMGEVMNLWSESHLVILSEEMSGALSAWRKIKAVPIIGVVPAARERHVRRRIEMLNAGARDCISMPFSVSEMLARVKVHLRPRMPLTAEIGESLVMDLELRTVVYRDVNVVTTNKEFELLHYLLERHNQVCTKSQLLAEVWGRAYTPTSRVVDTHVSSLRRKIGMDAIRNYHGVGYRLCLD